jgi:OPT family small oligopeptide transporter
LNPGKFSKKEHMLIAIMASTSMSLPISSLVAWTQILPQQFNQQYARSFGYRICLGISTNFIGYGLAGMTREFLVYPAYCIWPASITTISLNSALHEREGKAVPGPFGRIYHMSRYHFFLLTFGAMFVYFWFPNYLFTTLTYFSWMTWIAPTNKHNSIVNGFKNGLGMFNPWPTFDWNILLYDGLDPLMVPFFVTANRTLGMWLLGFVILAIFYTNTWNTGYFPINTNLVHDHFAKPYNVSRVVDDKGMFDLQRYVGYSGAYLSAALAVVYGCYYAIYTSAIVYVVLFHHSEFVNNLRPLWLKIRRKKGSKEETGYGYQDVHNRLMSAYKEVPGWWYLVTLLISAGFGWAGIGGWPTHTTLWVVPFGVLLAIIFMIPIGIINAMTGVHVTLNVLAEFIGGMWVEGNALAMNFFKLYG